MNHGTLIFVGVFLTFSSAWLGLVFFPYQQLGSITPQVDEVTGAVNPAPYSGTELVGRKVYIDEGCHYCHSQQVRGGYWNADLKRGWGPRRTVPLDYVNDNPALLGTMRTGPDLINIGARQPSEEWHYLHLYNPQITSEASIMPPYSFLFERRPIQGDPSPDALPLQGEWAPEPGFEIVPNDRGRALVAYLKSLDRTFDVQK
jgi:cytochrome c oxidase cbb3-type subunit 2